MLTRLFSPGALIAVAALLAATGCTSGGTVAPLAPPPVAAPLLASATTLTFIAAGSAHAQTFTVTEAGYAGTFTEVDTCAGVASVSPATATGPSAIFTVTPSASGSCSVTIKDGGGQTAGIAVSSAIPNAPMVSLAQLTFIAAGAANAQTFTVTEAGYAGVFAETDSCAGIATVASASPNGPSATFTVTPSATGSCSVTLKDSTNQSVGVGVGVAIPAPPALLTASASSMTFVAAGASNAQTLMISEIGYNGAFVEIDNCAGIATVGPPGANGPSAIYTITPAASGSCSIHASDTNNQTTTTAIGVTTSGLVIQSHGGL